MKPWIFRTALVLSTFVPAGQATGRDLYDITGDTVCGTSTAEIFHNSTPQIHDLEAYGGVNDVDYVWTRTIFSRSYEVKISGPGTAFASLSVTDSNGTPQAYSISIAAGSYAQKVSWLEYGASGVRCARIAATAALNSNSQYDISFRETTLFCPRYNNTGTQTSVLILQDARSDTSQTCDFLAVFRNEDGSVAGTVAQSVDVGATRVISTPSVSGVAGTKGSAQIAHTCGTGGLRGKLVALEPATGFSFDTICAQREP